MQKYMRVCPFCAEENKPIGTNSVAGWINSYKSEEILDGTERCYKHDILLEKKSMTCEEFMFFKRISKEPSFMEAMNDLKEKDIVEYQLKMSQFKSQLGQQDSSNTPKCPTCGSTNVSKISTTIKVADTVMFGIFGQKRKHQFRCNNCRYEW